MFQVIPIITNNLRSHVPIDTTSRKKKEEDKTFNVAAPISQLLLYYCNAMNQQQYRSKLYTFSS